MSMKRRTFLNLAAASVGSLALPRFGRADDRRSLTIAVQDLRTILEPVDASSIANVSWRVQYSIFDQLLRTDYANGFALNYALAEHIAPVDTTTFDINLRRGVLFHDGEEMTADDVVISLGEERLLGDKAPGAAVRANFQSTLVSVEKLGPYAVRLKTRSSDPVLMKRLAAWGTQIISAKAWRKAVSYSDWSLRPVGTGPYQIEPSATGDTITLIAHDGYWGGRPPFQSIRFKKIPEIAARVAGLQAGDYDIVTDLTPDHLAEIDGEAGLSIAGGDSFWYRFITFAPLRCPALADKKVRQAVALSVDRNALAQGLWGGRASVPHGWQLPIFGDLNDPARPALSYDPELAKKLLAESSYRGEEIPFPTVGNYYPMQMAENEAMVEMWKDVGLNVALKLCENWQQVSKWAGIVDTSGGAFYADPVATLWQVIGPTNTLQTRGDWKNAEFNQLGVELSSNMDPNKRRQIWQRMQDIVETDDPALTPLHSMAFLYGMRSDIAWQPYPVPQMYLGPTLPAQPVT